MDIYTTSILISILIYALVGNYAGRKVKHLEDYFVVGRQAPTLLIVGTLVASVLSTNAFLGETGFCYATQGGAYVLFAERYREILAREDITLNILETAGSVENLRLLEEDPLSIDIAFVQGGSAARPPADGLVSLASLYYEPLWVFYRDAAELTRITQLQHKRIATGEPGSGTQSVTQTLLQDNGLDDVEVLGLHDLLLRVIDFGTPSPEQEAEPAAAVENG